MITRCVAALVLPGLFALAGCAGQGSGATGVAGAVIPCGTGQAAPSHGDCGLVCRAELPVRMQDNAPIVTVWIGDRPADMLLDTGAAVTSLTTDGARRLGLAHTTAAPGRIWGLGGGQDRAMVALPRLAFGDISLSGGHVPVLVMGRSALSAVPDGGLGDDILHHYEIDLDFPHGVVRLYRGRPCDGPLPGWASQDAVLPWARPFANAWQVTIPVSLDGRPTVAMIDSGSETTVVGVPAALAAGVPQAELASDLEARMFGVGPGHLIGRLHRFDALVVGGQTVPDLETAVVDLPAQASNFAMVLGFDYLATHKVWISYTTGQVHVAHSW